MIKIEKDLDANGVVKFSTHCIDNNEGILKAKEKNLKLEDGEVITVYGCNFYMIYFNQQFYFMSNNYNFYNKEEI